MNNKKPLSVQNKLLLSYSLTSVLVIIVNIVLFVGINNITNSLNRAYETNVLINELADSLENVQSSMTDYLYTKSTDSIESYYDHEQEYMDCLQAVIDSSRAIEDSSGDIGLLNANGIMLENIANLSTSYLDITTDTVQSKRGRVVEKYNVSYEEAEQLYGYINSYIYSLNNEQFRNNSENYTVLQDSLKYLEMITILVLVIVAAINIILTRVITKNIMDPVQERELMMESHLKDAELKYLQAQINPHFLFNTLNAGAQLAMLEEADRTYEYIQNMAAFFRYKIKRNDKDTTLAEEIGLVDNYIYILNVRFSGEIHFVKNINEDCVNAPVPGMIIQPVVENAVNYGVRDIEREKIIRLSVYKNGDFIEIEVRDNGVGMTRERIEEVMSGNVSENPVMKDSNGVGLINVISRLRLFYGIEDVLDIKSEGQDKGTVVKIRIPNITKP
ncbi:MAG: histidine kinase [Lachnospiraceae bacterium]|nr:histidine kinase [Lachnospiraceae bacterium]